MAKNDQRALVAEVLRGLGAVRDPRQNTYAGIEPDNAARSAALLWMLSGLLILAFIPLDPPSEEIGTVGIAVAAVAGVVNVVGAAWLRRREPPLGFNDLLVISYLGLLQVAALQWLAGGAESEYLGLYLLWIASAMGVHPPARALAYLLVAGVVAFTPLLYDGYAADPAAEIATSYLVWVALGTTLLGLMVYVRAQRVALRVGQEAAQQLARADVLTGLGNRLAFDEALDAEIARARRAGSTMSVGLADLNDFKELNDRFGHLEGDRCLDRAAGAITEALRGGDRVFRWGGDEFALLFPDTSFTGAEDAMARIAASVMNGASAPDGRSLSIAWGLAELSEDSTSTELLGRADLALLANKQRRSAARAPHSLPDRDH